LTAVREKLKRQEKAGSSGASGSTLVSFVEMTGDLWELARGGVLAVTTNGCVDGRGEAVMGRGVALQAKRRFPGVAAKLGKYIQQYGNRCFDLGQFGEYRLVSFPTKDRWDRPADLGLIARSALQIVEMADKSGWPAVYMPRPGCGNGRLRWDQVRPILEPVLDGRFVVVSYR
jgi:hypothetical protein